jgi:hypothetical protein
MGQTKIRDSQLANDLGGWIPAGETWTYASATTFTISGDKTDKYQVNNKIKLTQTTAKYFRIVAISYSSPNTTVTVNGGGTYTLADASITSPNYSKIDNPQGFPLDPDKWTEIVSGIDYYDTFSRNSISRNSPYTINIRNKLNNPSCWGNRI